MISPVLYVLILILTFRVNWDRKDKKENPDS